MNKDVMFSVLVITYNQEKFIRNTLDSIINQVHNYSYEIVIGEDCSSDKTRKIIEEFAIKYPDIIRPLYNEQNKGLISNYFFTLSQCRGKYIMECAGDDYWLPGKVEKQISYLEKHKDIGVLYARSQLYNQSQKRLLEETIGTKKINGFKSVFLYGNHIPAPSVCYRNELIKLYIKDVKPLEKDWLMEDLPEWLWFYKESKIKFQNTINSVYRVLTDSASHSSDNEKVQNFNRSSEAIRRYFANKYKKEKWLDTWLYLRDFTPIWYRKNILELIKYVDTHHCKYLPISIKIKIFFIRHRFLFKLVINNK